MKLTTYAYVIAGAVFVSFLKGTASLSIMDIMWHLVAGFIERPK